MAAASSECVSERRAAGGERRAEGNEAVLRVNYTQSHTQFTPANLVSAEQTWRRAPAVGWHTDRQRHASPIS